MIQIRDVRDNFSKQITNREYHGKTKTKRSRAADPIKTKADVRRVREYILNERPYRNEDMRKRDYLLFSLGITVGLRAGDLRQLKVGDMLDENGILRHSIRLNEDKTGKDRTIILSETAMDALRLYFKDRPIDYEQPLFGNLSRNNCDQFFDTLAQKPKGEKTKVARKTGTTDGLTVRSISRILQQIVDEAGVNVHGSSHMLRKTFAYHIADNADDWNRGTQMAQNLLNHSSQQMTLRYLGLAGEEEKNAYLSLNFDDDEAAAPTELQMVKCQ